MEEPNFTIGVEEEYLLVDLESCALAEAPTALMEECAAELEGQVSPEFLQCQIEIGTRVCARASDAREELKRLRSTIAKRAKRHGLAPIAAACHPFSDWKTQRHTDKDRYRQLDRALAGVAQRLLICGMHVHVGFGEGEEGDALRTDLMPQMSYFLPHLLGLSCSSPFWQGRDTGLSSYRIAVFASMPRTGLPPGIASWAHYQRMLKMLIDSGVIEDGTKIWWDLRPSHRFPTLESRICDVCPRLEDAVTIAAATQALMRMLWRLKKKNQRWREYDRFLIAENRWRAQRYGVAEGLIDFGRGEIMPFDVLVAEIRDLIEEDAAALGSTAEIEGMARIVAEGNGADRQRRVFEAAHAGGADREEALRAVVRHLIEDFHVDL
ncbi:MAG: carboxylate-amine ligase [Paracoccaceae bacterium]